MATWTEAEQKRAEARVIREQDARCPFHDDPQWWRACADWHRIGKQESARLEAEAAGLEAQDE